MRGVGIPIDIDADFADHLFGDGWVGFRRFHHHGAAVPDVRATIERELITFRMAAEVIVIVEEQDACVRIDIATIDVCGRQATDACTNDDEVVVLINAISLPALALYRGVCRFE